MDTSFINGTVIEAAWLNEVNDFVYNAGFVNCLTDPYNADPTGTNDSWSAIQSALNSGVSDVFLGKGVFKITAPLNIPNGVRLRGNGFEANTGVGATIIKKSGNFTGIILNVCSRLVDISIEGDTGNGGDGIQVLGGRSVLHNVSSLNHGQDGVHIGGYSTDPHGSVNTNLWRVFNLITRGNTRHGCYVRHEGAGAAPNNNAGILLGLDSGYNGGCGLKIEESFDNEFYGTTCQVNGLDGVLITTNAKGNFISSPYLEANNSIAASGVELTLDAASSRNYVMFSRGGALNSGYIDSGTGNLMLGRYASVQDVPLHESPEAFSDLRFLEKTTSGIWKLYKEAASRNLNVDLVTSASADLVVKNTGGGDAGIRFASGAYDGAIRGIIKLLSTSVNQAVAANSTADVTISITGASSAFLYTATPTHAINAGITWLIFWNGTNIILRLRNHTAGSITVNGAFNIVGKRIV